MMMRVFRYKSVDDISRICEESLTIDEAAMTCPLLRVTMDLPSVSSLHVFVLPVSCGNVEGKLFRESRQINLD